MPGRTGARNDGELHRRQREVEVERHRHVEAVGAVGIPAAGEQRRQDGVDGPHRPVRYVRQRLRQDQHPVGRIGQREVRGAAPPAVEHHPRVEPQRARRRLLETRSRSRRQVEDAANADDAPEVSRPNPNAVGRFITSEHQLVEPLGRVDVRCHVEDERRQDRRVGVLSHHGHHGSKEG